MKTIQELFNDWVEPDVASYYLACLLGIMSYDDSWNEFRRVKGVFWTNNLTGTMLYRMLEMFVEISVMEKNDESQYRWNKSFDAYWLKTETPRGSDTAVRSLPNQNIR